MKTVIGLFKSADEAKQAAQKLYSSGFTKDNVDVSVRDSNSSYYSDADMDSESTNTDTSNTVTDSMYGKRPDDIKSNVTKTATGDYSNDDDEGIGAKVSKFFKNLFGDDDNAADRYSHVANKTGNLVTVHATSDEEANRASDILDENGAINIDDSAEEYGYSNANINSSSDTDSNTLNVIKEDVNIGKKEVKTGGVRLRSRIIERPVEEELRLKEETVTVERKNVNRPASNVDMQNFKEGVIEMTENAEIPVIQKTARVVEEVKLSKDVNERTQTVKETAKDTEVDVENLSKDDMTKYKGKNKDY
ncbi:MAG: DUF2382 domain-containing protein [Bacteroidota bacterium]|nr:DUF2382 domain-containing protein [Bacteroidota bacterium]